MKDFLSWILLKIIFWLVVCIMPTPIKIVNQSWTCLKLKQILFKYMLSSVFLETIQSSRHASHSLQYKGSWLYAQCSSQ
jgi:hypothetical protein